MARVVVAALDDDAVVVAVMVVDEEGEELRSRHVSRSSRAAKRMDIQM